MFSLKKVSIAILLLVFSGCKTSNPVATSTADASKVLKNQLTYLALGDSYTIGEMVEQPFTFPFQLAKAIADKTDFEVTPPTVIAKTGWRTDELLDSITVVKSKYDLVSVLIGVNNQYQGKDISQFTEELKTLLEKAISFSKSGKKGVFVYSIPDYSVMPFMRGKDIKKVRGEIKSFNAVCSDVAQQYGVSFYDITPISQKAEFDSSLIADDKLHPSGTMYKIWVSETIDQIISNQLR